MRDGRRGKFLAKNSVYNGEKRIQQGLRVFMPGIRNENAKPD